MEFIFSFRFLVFWLLAALCSHLAFRGHPALETCLYARFFLDRFCAGYDSASQAGGGTEEPIYSQSLLLEPRHGLPPPLPQIASPFAAQINFRGKREDTSHGPVSPCRWQLAERLDTARRLQQP